MSDTHGAIDLAYSYIIPDTTTFYVSLYGFKRWTGATSYDGIMTMSDGSPDVLLHEFDDGEGFQPRVNAYIEQHLKRSQTLAMDFNATLLNWHNWRDYAERYPSALDYITDVQTSIRDRNQTYSLSIDYIKRWGRSRLTAGASYTANRNRSTYENLDGAVFHQRQDKAYFYCEYYQKINKLSLTAGLGAQCTAYKFRETGLGNTSWNLRPKATIAYALGDVSSFKLSFSAWPESPTLSQTNSTPQQIDGFQWRVGNPNLKVATSYHLTFRYNLTLSRIYAQLGARSYICANAITPYLYWQNGSLVTSYENSKGYRDFSIWIAPQADAIPQWLTISGRLQYSLENSRGNGYNHTNRNLSGHVTAMLQHWGFSLTAQYRKADKTLWGETISWGESFSMLTLGYSWRDWQFTAGALCPFTRYDRGGQSLNQFNSNLMHIRTDIMPMPFLQISCNVLWGKQRHGVKKLVNADSDVQRSSTAGK